jgi:pimeloyl-ACP methyl ester carboxylesterase
MDAPVRYAKNGDVNIAYRVFGAGSRDVVLVPGTLSHVEVLWEMPVARHLLHRLTAFARVIVFDKRGQGLSDRVAPTEHTLEERIADLRAVMDAAGSERATLYGWSEGGLMCLMFCATYPERVSSLGLYGTFASRKDPPWSQSKEQVEERLAIWTDHWGEGILLEFNAPSLRNDPAVREVVGRLERASASPGNIRALMRANYQLDGRHLLPVITAPTLILHRVADALVPVACGRYLAEHIPNARFVEIPGTDHTILDIETQDVVADHIEEFITGQRQRPEPDRVLATVMFTDIVGSTQRAAAMGDSRWRELRDNWYSLMRKELTAFRGREVDTAGDGLLATFDGPARAIRCAASIREHVHTLGLQVRTGVHTGECELAGDKVVGIAVHIGARVAAAANPDEVVVSSTVRDLVAGSGLKFGDRGMHHLKGVPDEWHLYAVQ